MPGTTRIADKDVPLAKGELVLVRFDGGRCGDYDVGEWEFWTAVNAANEGVTTRCRPGADPGERFRRMEDRAGEEEAWGVAREAVRVEPASRSAVAGWLHDHPDDAPHAQCHRIVNVKPVTLSAQGYSFETSGA